jgi:hypothetical protein
MTAYTDYTYYTGTYLGSIIASTDFAALALRASAYLDRLTFDRTAPVVTAATDTTTIDKIKMAVCAIAELLAKDGDTITGTVIDGVQSESLGESSITFNPKSSAQKTFSMKMLQVAELYLGSSSLLYKGFADDEYSDEYRHHIYP